MFLQVRGRRAHTTAYVTESKTRRKGARCALILGLAESYRLCANLESQIKEQSLWTAFLFPLPIRLSCCAF